MRSNVVEKHLQPQLHIIKQYMPPRVALGWHKLGAFGGTWLKTNAIFGSLEGEKSRGEKNSGKRLSSTLFEYF